MNYLLKVALMTSLLLTLTPQRPIYASHLEQRTLSKRLENALNKKDIDPLIDLLPEKDGIHLASRYKTFLQAFPNAKWTIKETKPLKDGRQSWEILITAQTKLQNDQYSISSRQVLGVTTLEGRITNKEIISEETIIQKGKSPLQISLNIPEAVLTGTSYDLDIVLEKPLGDAIIAGGLSPLNAEQIENQLSPSIEISPLGGGGLFKSVKAPLKAGVQNWAAVLAHPEGLISITKMVRVVSNESDLEL